MDREDCFRVIVEGSPDGIVVVGMDGVVRLANRAAADWLDGRGGPVVGRAFGFDLEVGTTQEVHVGEPGAARRFAELRVCAIELAGERVLLASLRDVTLRVQQREALRGLVLLDDLTGLLNRRGLMALGPKLLAQAARTGRGLLLLFVDIDGMKWINDNLGHDTGDRALSEFADVLRSTLRLSDLASRVGGDEFVVLVPDATEAVAETIATRLRTGLSTRNSGTCRNYRLSFSLGSACFDPDAPVSLDHLMRQADQGMYRTKRERRESGFFPGPVTESNGRIDAPASITDGSVGAGDRSDSSAGSRLQEVRVVQETRNRRTVVGANR